MKLHIHFLISGALAFVLWLLHDIPWQAILVLLLANLIDLDHLWTTKGSIKKALREYRLRTSYPLHKLYILVPAIVFGLNGILTWLSVGLLIHLILDFIENEVIFRKRIFRWF